MKTMMFGLSVSSFMIALRRSSNCRDTSCRDDQRDVEGQDPLVGEKCGTSP
jgi:hypothetical protein